MSPQNKEAAGIPFRCGFVVLAGLPNVGKSTLMNRLSGHKLSIVSPRPQTTRNNILAIAEGDGYQAVFLDTPGLLKPEYNLQKHMLHCTRKAAREDADIICLLADPALPREEEASLFSHIIRPDIPVLLAINKMDALKDRSMAGRIESFYCGLFPVRGTFKISALTGEGVEALKSAIVESLPEHPAYYPKGQWTDRWERFYAAEMIREQIFTLYSQEIPYSTAVEIESFSERTGEKDRIRAVLHVERPSQKPLLIGKAGRNLKKLRENSQSEIEKLTGRKTMLELWVKVTPDWKNDPRFIKKLDSCDER